jgi:hypothetical protein
MAMAKKEWEGYMYHEASQFFDMKMPKIELIFQLLKPNYICCPNGIPPASNNSITCINIF